MTLGKRGPTKIGFGAIKRTALAGCPVAAATPRARAHLSALSGRGHLYRGPSSPVPPSVAEVALDHAAGLAVPAADPTPVFLGRRPDDAVTADFLNKQSAGLF